MLIVCSRPQSPPFIQYGQRYTWVTTVPVQLRCSVYMWRERMDGAWGWSHAWFYNMPANTTWQQVIDSFPDMADEFRTQYKTDYHVFVDPELLAEAQWMNTLDAG